MKIKNKFYSKTIGCIIAMLAIVLGISSCKDDFTTDDGSFALYYMSMTDIAPSMSGVIASPTYKGAAPYDFKITGISYSNKNEKGEEVSEAYTGECFTINSENGEISINSSKDMKTGKYFISVSCYAAGKMYTFNNAVEVNFLKAVPDGIIVEPNFIEVKLADVNDKDGVKAFPTAKVTTENTAEHITIAGYKLSNVVRLESDGSETVINNSSLGLFSVSDQGVISINRTTEATGYDPLVVKPGLYRIDLKLTTMASPTLGEEEGLFVDAMRINLSGAPTAISYEEGAIETGVENDPNKPRGEFKSSKPLIEGSPINAVYEIAAIKKSSGGTLTEVSEAEKEFFSIDASSGIISVPNTHTFVEGEVYKVSVKVSNSEGSCVGENALTLNVVEWVDPLVDFTYKQGNMKQGMSFESAAANYGTGSYVKYSFKSLPEGYEDFFSLDEETGVVKIEKYNTLPRTEEGKPFVVEVMAKNFKDEVTGKLEINVNENPNYFSYISYGNNLVDDKTPGSIYDNQYRFTSMEEANAILNLTPVTDVKEGQAIKWKVVGKHQYSHSNKDKPEENHQFVNWDNEKISISMQKPAWDNVETTLTVLLVSATVGEGEEAFTRTVPLCFNYVKPQGDGTAVLYTPFVFHVNPKKGGRSVVPEIINPGKFVMDYRRSFNYYNINGVDSKGNPLKEGSPSGKGKPNVECFLTDLWQSVANSTNFGAKLPMSYWEDSDKALLKDPLTLSENTLAYVDNTSGENKFSVVVTKNFNHDGWGDGIVTGQMTFVTDGNVKGVSNGKRTFPIAIWLDKTYINK